MLVLSRKKNESIVINDDITVVVVEIRGDRVRLGIEAPKEIPQHRRQISEESGKDHPHKKKLQMELAEINKEAGTLKTRLAAIERRQAELTKELEG